MWTSVINRLRDAELLAAFRRRASASEVLPRLIPLRWKERLNRLFGRDLFDLSFYLQFQPASLPRTRPVDAQLPAGMSRPRRGKRALLITPHLGVGGAERVLMRFARAIRPEVSEIRLVATHSTSSRWLEEWHGIVDEIDDLAQAYRPADRRNVVYSLARQGQYAAVVLQNSLFAYSVLSDLHEANPALPIIDIVHACDPRWDLARVTLPVSDALSARVAVSVAVKRRVAELGVPDRMIHLIRCGVDLDTFALHGASRAEDKKRILFAGRLDAVKNPLLLVPIAEGLVRRWPRDALEIVVAGEGPEDPVLRRKIRAAGLQDVFRLTGVRDIPPLLRESAMLLMTSRQEGIPLAMLEAMAAGLPVIAPLVGGIPEVLDASCGLACSPAPARSRGMWTRWTRCCGIRHSAGHGAGWPHQGRTRV